MSDIALLGLTAGISVAAGMEPRRIGVLIAALVVPVGVIGLVGWTVLRERKESENRAALFTESVAGELRAGAVLHDALVTASVGLGFEVSGDDVESIGSHISSQLPGIGPELRTAIGTAASSGASMADLFDEIGSIAIAQAEVSREVRVATAPARATALVFAGAPAIYLLYQLRGGGLPALVSSSGQRLSGLLGLGLFAAGLTAVAVILWRAS